MYDLSCTSNNLKISPVILFNDMFKYHFLFPSGIQKLLNSGNVLFFLLFPGHLYKFGLVLVG